MVICFYINTLGLGGAERVVANLANHLSKNHSVIVINSFKVKNEYILDPCVKHIYIDTNEYRTKLFRNIHRISFLRRFLKTERPNVTISFMAEPNFRLMVAKIGLKSKTIVSVRNDPTREYSGFFGKIIAKLLLVRADGCVFQTKDAKKWFSQKLQNKSTIILNPVDKVFFDNKTANNPKDIVSCGRLSPQKNHKLLIKAFSLIKDQIDDNLVIYGEGDLRNELVQYSIDCGVGDRVSFPGQTNEIVRVLKESKVFVLSSDYEGMPNVLMEALALGIPCISTDCPCGGPKDIITDMENGLLVPVCNPDIMAKSMLLLIKNLDLRKKIGSKARILAIQSFHSDIIFQEWEKYIFSIILN